MRAHLRSAFACFAVTTLAASIAPAQELRAGGGIGLPLQPSEFTDLYDIGFHGGLELNGAVGRNDTGHVGLAVYHHRFPIDEDGVLEIWRNQGVPTNVPYEIEGGTFILTEVLLTGRLDLRTQGVKPYLLGGLGAGITDATTLSLRLGDVNRSASAEAEVDPMLTAGFGVTMPISESFGIFAQARISIVLTDGDTTMLLPITAGISFE